MGVGEASEGGSSWRSEVWVVLRYSRLGACRGGRQEPRCGGEWHDRAVTLAAASGQGGVACGGDGAGIHGLSSPDRTAGKRISQGNTNGGGRTLLT